MFNPTEINMLDFITKNKRRVSSHIINPDYNTTENQEQIKEYETGPEEKRLMDWRSRMDTAPKNLKEFSKSLLSLLSKEMDLCQGAFFLADKKKKIQVIRFVAGYAYHIPESENIEFEFGEGLSGQVAQDGKLLNIKSVPEGYITVLSGLGEASPTSMIIIPVKNGNQVIAVIELASFHPFTQTDEDFIKSVSPIIGKKIIQITK